MLFHIRPAATASLTPSPGTSGQLIEGVSKFVVVCDGDAAFGSLDLSREHGAAGMDNHRRFLGPSLERDDREGFLLRELNERLRPRNYGTLPLLVDQAQIARPRLGGQRYLAASHQDQIEALWSFLSVAAHPLQ